MLKAFARACAPPVVWDVMKKARAAVTPPAKAPQFGFSGDYPSFEAAARECGDYESPSVLDRTLGFTKALKHAPQIDQLHIRLLAAIQYALARLPANPRILDFGGSLGAQYFLLNGFLPPVASWTIVELPATVRVGRQLEDGVLKFAETPEPADLVIARGALQYMPAPYAGLARLLPLAPYLVLDKVPLWERDRITVQRADTFVMGASFVAWFFGRENFMRRLPEIVMSWDLPGGSFLHDKPIDTLNGFVVKTR